MKLYTDKAYVSRIYTSEYLVIPCRFFGKRTKITQTNTTLSRMIEDLERDDYKLLKSIAYRDWTNAKQPRVYELLAKHL